VHTVVVLTLVIQSPDPYDPWPGTLIVTPHPQRTSTTILVGLCIHSSAASHRYRMRSSGSAVYVLPRTRTWRTWFSSTAVRPPGTLFLPISTTLLIPVLSKNDSRLYFLIVLITHYCWRSWTCRTVAPYKYRVDWLIDWLIGTLYGEGSRYTVVLSKDGPGI